MKYFCLHIFYILHNCCLCSNIHYNTLYKHTAYEVHYKNCKCTLHKLVCSEFDLVKCLPANLQKDLEKKFKTLPHGQPVSIGHRIFFKGGLKEGTHTRIQQLTHLTHMDKKNEKYFLKKESQLQSQGQNM